MSKLMGRLAMAEISGRPAFVSREYATSAFNGSEVTSGSMMADIRELGNAVVADESAMAAERNRILASSYGFDKVEDGKPFVFSGGFALIPIHGFLCNRLAYSWGFATGYNFLRNQIAAAKADPDVTTIIYDVNTCGGGAAGCQETADVVFGARGDQEGGKLSIAVIDSTCQSAGYFLASQCDHVVMTPSGTVGSIGVLMMHFDVSKMMEEAGVKITFITAGDHKVDGNPYEPLSEDVAAEFQAKIDATYDTFVAAVMRGRDMSEEAIRGTEARSYGAAEALALGLVDDVQNPSDAVEAYFNSCTEDDDDGAGDDPDADEPEQTENSSMTTKIVPTGKTPAVAASANTEVTSDTTVADARATERARISGITAHAEATGREELARHLAFDTEMSVDAAVAILAKAPKEAPVVAAAPPAATPPAAETSEFSKAMASSQHPEVGASAGQAGSLSPASRILASQTKATGVRAPKVAVH